MNENIDLGKPEHYRTIAADCQRNYEADDAEQGVYAYRILEFTATHFLTNLTQKPSPAAYTAGAIHGWIDIRRPITNSISPFAQRRRLASLPRTVRVHSRLRRHSRTGLLSTCAIRPMRLYHHRNITIVSWISACVLLPTTTHDGMRSSGFSMLNLLGVPFWFVTLRIAHISSLTQVIPNPMCWLAM